MTRRTLISVVLLVASFVGGYLLGRNHIGNVTEKVDISTDTIYYERPQPVRITYRLVNVPVVLFAPRDTIRVPVVTDDADTVNVAMTYTTKTYQDSTYTAQVSGLSYGGYEPTLDWIKTYNTTQTITKTRRSRFAIVAGAGVAWTPKGLQPTIGVQAGVVLWGR